MYLAAVEGPSRTGCPPDRRPPGGSRERPRRGLRHGGRGAPVGDGRAARLTSHAFLQRADSTQLTPSQSVRWLAATQEHRATHALDLEACRLQLCCGAEARREPVAVDRGSAQLGSLAARHDFVCGLHRGEKSVDLARGGTVAIAILPDHRTDSDLETEALTGAERARHLLCGHRR